VYHSVGGQKFFAGNGSTNAYLYTGSTGFYFLNSNDTSTLMTLLNGGNLGIGTTTPSQKLDVNGIIKSGIAGNSSANSTALLVTSAGTATSQAALAIQQATTEGDTIIFADYEPYVEYNFMHENSTNQFMIHGGGSTNNLGSNTFYNRSGTARTGYIKHIFNQDDGNMYVGGNVGIGTSTSNSKLTVGPNFASIVGIEVNTNGTSDSAFATRRASNSPVFGILPWTSQVFLSAGTYYDGGSWVQNSDTTNSQLFAMTPATGILWYASSNSSVSWNLADGITLWDTGGRWKSSVQSTRAENSYFSGGNLGVGTTSPANTIQVVGDHGIYKNGSDTISSQFYIANAANTRAFNFQLNSGGTTLDLWSFNSANAWQRSVSFDYNGNVGFGATSDGNGRLYAYGAGNTSNFLSIANANGIATTSSSGRTLAGYIRIYINNSVSNAGSNAFTAGNYYIPVFS
jgi:hypothetical protein